MADWLTTWRPRSIESTPVFSTQVTRFESGVGQYASLWSNPAYRIHMEFDYETTKALLYAITAFFVARKGQYEAFTFPFFPEYIQGTTLALVDSGPDTITDSGNGILNAKFRTSGKVTIYGSATSGNNKVCDIHATTAPAAGTLTLAADETLTADSANTSLIIYNTYDVHFASDEFWQRFIQVPSGAMRSIDLIAEAY